MGGIEEEEEEEKETSTDGAVVVDENEVDFHNLTKPITNATSDTSAENVTTEEYPLDAVEVEVGGIEEETIRSRRAAGRPSYYGTPSLGYYHENHGKPIHHLVDFYSSGGTYQFRPLQAAPVQTTLSYIHVIRPTAASTSPSTTPSTTSSESFRSTSTPPPVKVVTKPTKRPSFFWF